MLTNVKRSQKNTEKLTIIWYYQLCHVFLRPLKIISIFLPSRLISTYLCSSSATSSHVRHYFIFSQNTIKDPLLHESTKKGMKKKNEKRHVFVPFFRSLFCSFPFVLFFVILSLFWVGGSVLLHFIERKGTNVKRSQKNTKKLTIIIRKRKVNKYCRSWRGNKGKTWIIWRR